MDLYALKLKAWGSGTPPCTGGIIGIHKDPTTCTVIPYNHNYSVAITVWASPNPLVIHVSIHTLGSQGVPKFGMSHVNMQYVV